MPQSRVACRGVPAHALVFADIVRQSMELHRDRQPAAHRPSNRVPPRVCGSITAQQPPHASRRRGNCTSPRRGLHSETMRPADAVGAYGNMLAAEATPPPGRRSTRCAGSCPDGSTVVGTTRIVALVHEHYAQKWGVHSESGQERVEGALTALSSGPPEWADTEIAGAFGAVRRPDRVDADGIAPAAAAIVAAAVPRFAGSAVRHLAQSSRSMCGAR